jgi:predicted Zn finger-like uncharacterized protein
MACIIAQTAEEATRMSTRIVCPACGAAFSVPDDRLGRKVRCRECDELIVARRAPKRRRPKGELSPLMIFAATFALLVILVAGGLGAYFLFGRSPPPKQEGPPEAGPLFPPGVDENPLIERQAHLEAYFRAPEEPPVSRLEFTEPPWAAPDGPAPEPVANPTGQLAPAVLQKIKESTVYLRVQMNQGAAEGSGFLAGAPGFVVTNAHVVGMLGRSAPPPASVQVVRNKGEKNEITLAAQLVAVDPDADLALLSVPREGLPAPLTVKSAERLRETQPVYVAGFPLGELPGKNVSINKYDLSSLKKENGVLEKLQVHGDMLPGNSGGPVLDAEGDVVGVCVSILVNTRINFAIPGDKVLRFLDGHLAELTLETPVRADSGLRVPVAVRVIDPLGRVARAAVECWVAKPGPARPGSRTPPTPQPGDGPRQELALALQQQAGRGELALPPLPAGQAYWLRPSLVSRSGARVWLSAQVYRPPEPVERKPARLVWQPPDERKLVLERWSVLQYTDAHGHDHRGLLTGEVRLTDTARGKQGADLALYRQFTGLKEGVSIDGQVYMPGRLEYVPANLQLLADTLLLDAQGTTRRYDIDVKLRDATPAAKVHLAALEQDVERFLQGLEVPLPGKEVRPGETWSASRPLPIDGTWKELEVVPAQAWMTAENESLEVTYTYEGVRSANGAERAVIRLRGQAAPRPGGGRGAGALVSGTALVDVATGQVVEEEVTAPSHVELVFLNMLAAKAQGTVAARLRRE